MAQTITARTCVARPKSPVVDGSACARPLLDLARDGVEKRFAPSSDQVVVARSVDPAGR